MDGTLNFVEGSRIDEPQRYAAQVVSRDQPAEIETLEEFGADRYHAVYQKLAATRRPVGHYFRIVSLHHDEKDQIEEVFA